MENRGLSPLKRLLFTAKQASSLTGKAKNGLVYRVKVHRHGKPFQSMRGESIVERRENQQVQATESPNSQQPQRVVARTCVCTVKEQTHVRAT